MTDAANEPPAPPNPAVDDTALARSEFLGAWWGILAFAVAMVGLAGSIVALARGTAFGIAIPMGTAPARFVILAQQVRGATLILVTVSLLIGNVTRRSWALAATSMYVLAIIVDALATQRALG